MWSPPVVSDLVGKTFSSVKAKGDELHFVLSNGKGSYTFKHDNDCCEYVSLEDVIGDLSDLENSPILTAECRTENNEPDDGTELWTFYEFATNKGSVTVRWYGSSNGYYSVDVDLHFYGICVVCELGFDHKGLSKDGQLCCSDTCFEQLKLNPLAYEETDDNSTES